MGGPSDGGVRPEIASSWTRSAWHISPQVTQAPLTDPDDALAAWESSPLCVAVRAIETELRAAADDGDLVVAVTDPEARILWTDGGSVMRRRAEKVNFVPGGRWDEQSVGTNALDLALRLDQAATVYSAEHFASCVHDWVCWAAPVHDPGTGRQLGVLDLSTTWDRAHPIGLATAGALAKLVERQIRPGTTAVTTAAPGDSARRAVFELRLLGSAGAQVNGRSLRLTRRQLEILALLVLSSDGLELGDLHAQLYGDRPVSKATLKAEMSVLRAALGRRLTSRPYRVDMPVWCDACEVLDQLRRGDVGGAVERYRGELLGWSDSPAIAEYRDFLAAAVRTALLAESPPPAVLRYTQRVPYDLEPLERYAPAAATSRRDLPLANHRLLTLPSYEREERQMAANAYPALLWLAVPPQFAPGSSHPDPSPPPAAPPLAGDQGRALPPGVDVERRRLARELHDNVIQQVLAAGLTIDWCMSEVPAGSPVHEQLAVAKRLTCDAVRKLRSSLQELTQSTDGADEDLPDMLTRLLDTHARPRLRLSLQVCGTPQPLPPATRRWLYRFAGECLFNSAVHTDASHAAIRLRYADGAVMLSVADDGHGRPETLRKIISGEAPGISGGYHFGLTDIAAGAREMGWTLRVSRADLGGIAMEVRLPAAQVPVATGDADE